MSTEDELDPDMAQNVLVEESQNQEVKSVEINIQVIKAFFINTISMYEYLIKKSCKGCNVFQSEEFICLHANLCEFNDLFKLFNIPFDRTLLNNVVTIKDEERQKFNIIQISEDALSAEQSSLSNVKTFPCLVNSCHIKYCSEEAVKIHFMKNHCNKSDIFNMVDDENSESLDFSQVKRDDEGRYFCEFPECSYMSNDRSNFKVHYMRHTGNKKFVCHLCSKSFFTRDPLMIHFLRLHMKEVNWNLALKDVRALRKTIKRLTNRQYCDLASNDEIPDSDSDLTGPVNEESAVLNAYISQAICDFQIPSEEACDSDGLNQDDPIELEDDTSKEDNSDPINSFNICLNLKDNDFFNDSVTFKSEGAVDLNEIINKIHDPNASIKTTMSLPATKDVMVNKEIKQRVKKYKCPHKFCHQDFFTKKNLLIHLKASHDPENPIPCQEPGCSARFKSSALLAQHQKRHRVQYTCKVCPYKTHLAALMTRHNRQHAGAQLFHECSVCHEKFEYLGSLSTHRRKVHNEKEPLACDWTDCDKKFKTIIGLNKHRREFHLHMKAEIACEWPDCTAVFSNRTSMSHHMRIHTNERPYQCTWQDCGKWFRLKETLKRHIKLHQGYKPHPCPFDNCDRAFVTKRNMKMHIEKIHLKHSSAKTASKTTITEDTSENEAFTLTNLKLEADDE